MASSPSEQQVAEFVQKLVSTGGWFDEVVMGLGAELPMGIDLGRNPRGALIGLLSRTIGPALHSVDARDVQRATELMDLAAARLEQQLKRAGDLSGLIDAADASAGDYRPRGWTFGG
jgi:hypothetical protein